MDSYAINVINSIIVNPDTNRYILDMKIYVQDPDAFHGYMNNFVSVFQESISKKTLTLVREYNEVYQKWSNDQTLLQMANKFDAEQISDLFGDFNVSPSVDSVLRGISKSSISNRRGPSKKKRNQNKSKSSGSVPNSSKTGTSSRAQ